MSDGQRSGRSTGRVSCKSTELKRCSMIVLVLFLSRSGRFMLMFSPIPDRELRRWSVTSKRCNCSAAVQLHATLKLLTALCGPSLRHLPLLLSVIARSRREEDWRSLRIIRIERCRLLTIPPVIGHLPPLTTSTLWSMLKVKKGKVNGSGVLLKMEVGIRKGAWRRA